MIVVGGGLAGVACARRLHDAGCPVRLLDRGHRLGGRLAVRTETVAGAPHPVDLGAPYFTVGDADSGFAEVVAGWERARLARRWTDTFATAGTDGLTGVTTGPQRWSAAGGLRRLVEALADGLDVRLEHPVTRVELPADGALPGVDGEPATAVVLAMPDPQAVRLLPPDTAAALGVLDRAWSPVITVRAIWPQRCWPAFDGIFVDSPAITWIADSGRSRGDGAPVLVVHSTAELAEQHLADPSGAIEPVLAELGRVLGGALPPPDQARAHRWTFATTREPHPEPFVLHPVGRGSGLVGVCGDGWGPKSRVEQAWNSGTALAEMLLNRLPVSSGASPNT